MFLIFQGLLYLAVAIVCNETAKILEDEVRKEENNKKIKGNE